MIEGDAVCSLLELMFGQPGEQGMIHSTQPLPLHDGMGVAYRIEIAGVKVDGPAVGRDRFGLAAIPVMFIATACRAVADVSTPMPAGRFSR